jgi:2'-5' RNA ligase
MAKSPSASAATPGAKPERWRLFVAIELPDVLRQSLREPLIELARIDEIRPSPIEQVHLTLHFLGHLDVDRIPALTAALAPAVRRHAAFSLEARGVNAFGGMRRPRVLWAAFADAGVDAMKSLRADTSTALAQLGLQIERDFRPHLTLGWVSRPLPTGAQQALQRWYAAWKDKDFGRLPVGQVDLMRSQLGGGPARHSTIERFELQ